MTASKPGTQLDLKALTIRLGVAAAVLAIATLVVGFVFVGSSGHGLVQPFDDAGRTWIRHLRDLRPLARLLSVSGSTWILLPIAAGVSAVIVMRKGDWVRGLGPVLSVALFVVVSAISKVVIGRPRPGAPGTSYLENFSYPSGHTGSAVALVTALVLAFAADWTTVKRWAAAALVLAVAIIVGLGRMLMSAHWASDVITGAVVGLTCAVVTRWALHESALRPALPTDSPAVEPETVQDVFGPRSS